MADTIKRIVFQEEIEARYSRHQVDQRIKEEIDESEFMQEKIAEGVEMVRQWASQDYYASKQQRLDALLEMDLEAIVRKIYLGIAYCQEPTTFTNITGQLAGRLGFEDKRDSITTIGELLAVLCQTDVFDIEKPSKFASLYVISRVPLSEETREAIFDSQFLPPMVCEPLKLKKNYGSGYLSFNESLILGNGNHHDGDIALDVINICNGVALKLATDFLSTVEEDPNTEFTIAKVHENQLKKGRVITDQKAQVIVEQQKAQWQQFKVQGYEYYKLMVRCGNRFHLTHKVDKRGRLYASGYHITTQGTAFKKASIELADEEIVEGVPT